MTKSSHENVQTVTLADLDSALSKLVKEREARTLIGAMPCSRGLLVVLFSHRYNEDHPILVSGHDSARILGKVHQALEGQSS